MAPVVHSRVVGENYITRNGKKNSRNSKINHKNQYVNQSGVLQNGYGVASDTENSSARPRREQTPSTRKRRRLQTPSCQRKKKKAKTGPEAIWTVEDVEPIGSVNLVDEPMKLNYKLEYTHRPQSEAEREVTPGSGQESSKPEVVKTAQLPTFSAQSRLGHCEGAAEDKKSDPAQGLAFDEAEIAPIPPLDWTTFDAEPPHERPSLVTLAIVQIGFYLFLVLSHLSRLLFLPKATREKNRAGYAPLYDPFEETFSKFMYRRGRGCYNQPVCSAPDADITLMERTSDDYNWTFKFTGRKLKCVNLGSYNYLGYRGGKDEVEAATRRYGLAMGSSRAELGSCPLHAELERELADFLGVEAAMVMGNGFSSNSLTLPGLLGPGTLVLSDAKNHASVRLGLRVAGVVVRVFRHNDMRHLEQLARQARAAGRWKKIVVMIEGIYSMEGSVAPLPAVIALKKKLGLHLYVDEAHSIGLGPRGRGITDMCGVSPRDVDVLMGTFTKSFASMGGYIAGSATLVNRMRVHGHADAYAQSMPPPLIAQVLSALRDLRAPSGQARLAALRENTHYFRERLHAIGVVILGHPLSPVVPIMVYNMAKMVASVKQLRAAGVASVGVTYPATSLYQSRMRFCVSAAHSREQLDKALAAIEAVADELGLRYSRFKYSK